MTQDLDYPARLAAETEADRRYDVRDTQGAVGWGAFQAGARWQREAFARTLPPAAPSGDREAVALVETDCNCRHPGSLGGDCDGSCVQTGIPGRVLVAAQPAEERAAMDAANHIETAPVPVKRMMPSEVKNRDREIAAEIREMVALDRARTGSEADQYDYTRDPCNQPENIR